MMMRGEKFFELSNKVMYYGFMLGALIIVIEDMPFQDIIIDPAIYIISKYPLLLSYMIVIGTVLFVINEMIRLIKLLKCKDKDKIKK